MEIGNFEDLKSRKCTDLTVNGECSTCGQCCGRILPVGESEIGRIVHYVRRHKIKPVHHFFPTNEPLVDMTCPFMDPNKKYKCRIYPVRPFICRSFICSKPQPTEEELAVMIRDNTKAVDMWKVAECATSKK